MAETGKTSITISFDENGLRGYTGEYLAMLWHVAQHNPADGFASSVPGDLAERIGREIIRRWLAGVDPELHHHQGRHYYWHELTRLATFEPGDGETGSDGWHDGHWVPKPADEITGKSGTDGSVRDA